jgi:hypothetical protein
VRTFSIRASAMPLAMLCPGSVRGELRIDEEGDAAKLGTAAHEGLRPLVELGSVQWESVPALATRFGVDEPELRMLLGLGTKLWREVEGSFPDPVTEVEMKHELHLVGGEVLTITGHADVLSTWGGVVRVADWKTGRKDSDYSQQALAYCALALLHHRVLSEATCTLLWVRDGEAEQYTMRRSELDAWLDSVIERVVRWDGVYRTGPHCTHCPRSATCEARRALVRRDLGDIQAADFGAIEALPAEQLVELLQKADHVATLARRARDAIRELVRARGDVIANGRRLTIVQEERRALRTAEVWPVLEQHLETDGEMAEVLEVSVTALERVVAKKAGRGKGAGAVRTLRQELEAAGAVEVQVIEKLANKRATEET